MVYTYIYIYANLGGILMVNVTIYSIHGSYGILFLNLHMKANIHFSTELASDAEAESEI